MPDKYTTDLAVMHVALETVIMPPTPSGVSKGRTRSRSPSRVGHRRGRAFSPGAT